MSAHDDTQTPHDCPYYSSEHDDYVVSRYDDAVKVLLDTEAFSSCKVIEPRQLPGLEKLEDGHPAKAALVNLDPPTHSRLRKILQPEFTRGRIETYRPVVEKIANELIDQFPNPGDVDLAYAYARKLAGHTIAGIVGASVEDDLPMLMRFQEDLVRSLVLAPEPPPDVMADIGERVVTYVAWLDEFVEARRREPRDDLPSRLIALKTQDGTPALSTSEVRMLITNVIGAAVENTSTVLCQAVYRLLTENAPSWNQAGASLELVPNIAAETLRRHSPVRGLRRVAHRPVTVSGTDIPPDSNVFVDLESALLDPSVFQEPETWWIDRADLSKNLGFGKGVHRCLGAPLGELEVEVGLETLLRRGHGLELLEPAPPKTVPSRHNAHVAELWVRWRSE